MFTLLYLHQRLGQGERRPHTSRALAACQLLWWGASVAFLMQYLAVNRKLAFFGSLWLPRVGDGWRKFRKHFKVHSWNMGYSCNKGWGGGGEGKKGLRGLSSLSSSASLVENLGCFPQVVGAGLRALSPRRCIHGRPHPPYLDSLCTVFVPSMNHSLY